MRRPVGSLAMRWARAAALGCALLLAALPSAVAGDPALAKFLLQHGKEALQKGDAAGALSKFEKAREEDPELVEVVYWQGAAREARNDPAGAIADYRAFVEQISKQETPAKDLLALQKKAQARLLVLDAARVEIDKAHATFGDQMVELARSKRETNPDLAVRALKLVLAVHPDHAEAARLLAELVGDVPGKGTLLAGLGKEWDLIASHGMGMNDGWTYGAGRLDLRVGKGALIIVPAEYDSGPTYAVEAVIERAAPPQPGGTTVFGMVFGWVAKNGFALMLVDNRMLIETFAASNHSGLAEKAIPPWSPGERRKITARVRGTRIEAFMDDKKMLDVQAPGRSHLAGNIGVVNENVQLTLHRFVLARPEESGK
jgi:hypothetical protein